MKSECRKDEFASQQQTIQHHTGFPTQLNQNYGTEILNSVKCFRSFHTNQNEHKATSFTLL